MKQPEIMNIPTDEMPEYIWDDLECWISGYIKDKTKCKGCCFYPEITIKATKIQYDN